GEAGGVDLRQAYAKESIGRAPLPSEPSTKEERPQRRQTRGSLDDLGPILDQAIPASLERRHSVPVPLDPDDQANTMDLRGKPMSVSLGDLQEVEPSMRMEAQSDEAEAPSDDGEQLLPSIA